MSGAIADGVVGPLPKVGAETDLHDVIRAVVEARKGDLADGSVTIEGKVEQARAPRRLVSKPRLSAALLNTPWLIHPTWLQALYAIADGVDVETAELPGGERSEAYRRGETIALERQTGVPLPGTRSVTVRGGVATIGIDGVIIPKASLFSEMSGAVSLRSIARDFNAALDSRDVRAILLAIDSPGGNADFVEEMASMIRAGAQRKPVWAYAGALMASAAYWVGSAADRIVAGRTASLGSIGTVAIVPTGDDDGYVEVVSSQSPKKRLDPESEEGRRELQDHVDYLSDIFISQVAENRGVDTQHVLDHFGQGGLLFGEQAVAAGMADGIGSYESTHAALVAHLDAQERSHTMTQATEERAEVVAEETPATVAAATDPRIAALEAQLAAAEERAATLAAERDRDRRADFKAKFVAKAKDEGWIGADDDHVAIMLALAPDAQPTEALAAYERTMRAAAGQKEVGAIFSEGGVSGTESPNSAITEAHALAGELVASGKAATADQALEQVFRANRALETRYNAEATRLRPRRSFDGE
jgi:ClpP class serine protease